MHGILVDVSGSMQTAYSLRKILKPGGTSPDSQATVAGAHAVITSILNIIKRKVDRDDRKRRSRMGESIFIGAFGLQRGNALETFVANVGGQSERVAIETCNLLFLLESLGSLDVNGHQELMKLAEQHGAAYAKEWIPKEFSEDEAKILYCALNCNAKSKKEMIHKIPFETTVKAAAIINK